MVKEGGRVGVIVNELMSSPPLTSQSLSLPLLLCYVFFPFHFRRISLSISLRKIRLSSLLYTAWEEPSKLDEINIYWWITKPSSLSSVSVSVSISGSVPIQVIMERKKEDSSSPVGVLEDHFRSEEESETCSLKEPTSDIESAHKTTSKSASRWHTFFRLLRTKSKKPLATFHPLSVLKLSTRRSSSMRETVVVASSNVFGDNASCNDSKFSRMNFTLSELQAATNNFNQGNLIGKGGYAEVYKGHLSNGKIVAIKRITKGTPDEIAGDFLSEMGIMAHVNHPNIVKLIGYGVEGGMHLVLELSPHGSLASLLCGSKEALTWDIRYKIALGTAEGLVYLHEGCKRRIIHRDIKAANILLNEDFQAQICDFGLAKWLPEHWTHHTVSKFEGTFGYLAPEYLMHGIVDEKTDVFAFGVLLLELVTGRRALDYSQQSLVLWAKPLLKKNEVRKLVDTDVGDDYDARQMDLVLLAASLCIQQSSIRRPQMTQVSQILNGNLSSLKCIKKCLSKSFP